MGRFSRGFVIGSILGLLLAPMSGQEMRHLVSERLQKLLGYLPDNMPVKQSAQQVIDRTSQVASEVKYNVHQATPPFKDAADQLSSVFQQAGSKVQQTAKDTADTVQQRASSTWKGVQKNTPVAQDTA